MNQFKHIKVDAAGDGVFVARMSRGPVNAIDREMYIELAKLFSDPDILGEDVRAIVLAAEGSNFCAGNDLAEFATMTPENGVERMWRVREAFFAIQDCPVPVIGAVHGVALGTGLAIAASCDFVVADREARFGLPELTGGVMGGARHLARMAPQPLVRRMYFTGEHMCAADMAAAGAALVVCERGELMDQALRFARRVASFSPTAVRVAKHILNRIETMDIREGYEFEQRYTVKMSGHPDAKEALKSLNEKRAPDYLRRSPEWTIDL